MKNIKYLIILIIVLLGINKSFAHHIDEDILTKKTQSTLKLLEAQGYSVISVRTANLFSGESVSIDYDFEEEKEYVVIALHTNDLKNLNLDAVSKSDGYILETQFTKKEQKVAIAFRNTEQEDLELLITNRRSKKNIACLIHFIVASK